MNCASHEGLRESLKVAFIEIADGDVSPVNWKLIRNVDPRQAEHVDEIAPLKLDLWGTIVSQRGEMVQTICELKFAR